MNHARETSSSCVRRLCAAATLVVAAAGVVAAHDFWLEPSEFQPRVGSVVRIRLQVGDHFAGEPVGRNDAKIERFFVVGPSGERPVVGRDGADPAGAVKIDAPGLWAVGYRNRPSRVELTPTAFEQYLVEEGLEHIIADRQKRGEATTPGREHFSRSVKSLLRTVEAGSEGFDRPLGLALELVPERDPWTLPDGRLPVRLLADGQPVAGVLIVSMRKGAGPKGDVLSRVRSDSAGRATVDVRPGLSMIKAVHMRRAPAGGDVDWASTWTSLTLEIPAMSSTVR